MAMAKRGQSVARSLLVAMERWYYNTKIKIKARYST